MARPSFWTGLADRSSVSSWKGTACARGGYEKQVDASGFIFATSNFVCVKEVVFKPPTSSAGEGSRRERRTRCFFGAMLETTQRLFAQMLKDKTVSTTSQKTQCSCFAVQLFIYLYSSVQRFIFVKSPAHSSASWFFFTPSCVKCGVEGLGCILHSTHQPNIIDQESLLS